jgi:hypothetical protein
MSLVAIGMVKDEEDVIERTVWNVAAQGADVIVLYDNGSTDETRPILNRLAREGLGRTRLEVYTDWEVAYYQARKMTELATYAGEKLGARWVWPFDADEVWTWPAGTIREALDETQALVVKARLVNHYETRVDPPAEHPFDRMVWRDPADLDLPKIITRWSPGVTIEAGNHAVGGALWRISPVDLGFLVHHFPYRSPEQFVRKARNGSAAYAATDLSEHTGRHWREYGAALAEHGPEALGEHYSRHFVYDDPEASGLVLDPAGVPPSL